LVAEQLRVAEGHPLTISQEAVKQNGHAVECRINAEDPAHDFQPSPGRIVEAHFPMGEGVRVDTHMEAGAMIPPYYDSMIAKLIAHGPTREEALRRLDAALAEMRLTGIKTNQQLHRDVLASPEFREGGVDTGFLGRWLADRASNASTGQTA
jgi:acetyl-CoA carboxylase biotin carboxylase subunit